MNYDNGLGMELVDFYSHFMFFYSGFITGGQAFLAHLSYINTSVTFFN